MSDARPLPSFANLMLDIVAQVDPDLATGVSFDETSDPKPFCLVSVLPGGSDRFEVTPIFDLEFIGVGYTAVENIALAVDHFLMEYPFSVTSSDRVVLVDRVDTISTPVELDFDEKTPYRRFLATYQLAIRRR